MSMNRAACARHREFRLAAIVASVLAMGAALAADAPAPAPAAAPLPSATNSLGMKLILIPAGQFSMGSPPGEWGRGRDEEPQRQVTITRPFLLSSTETTNGQFLAFFDAVKYEPVAAAEADFQFLTTLRGAGRAKYDKMPFNKPEYPVTWVSWFAACRFCNWLSEKEGRTPVYAFDKPAAPGQPPPVRLVAPWEGGYRLPTEAEWEYAARAGTATAFSFGPDDRKFSEYGFSMLQEPYAGAMATAPAVSRKPNPWGLYQMHGNVHEWVWDVYAPRYDTSRVTDPLGPDVGELRVTRGGTQRMPANYGRSAARLMDDPCVTRYGLGFRVARNLAPGEAPPQAQ